MGTDKVTVVQEWQVSQQLSVAYGSIKLWLLLIP